MTRILILNDIHSGTSRESSTHPGEVRQANNEALAKLEEYIPKFNAEKYDLAINLGDAIRDENDRIKDIELLNASLQIFANISTDKVYIPGNHEYKTLNEGEILKCMENVGIHNDLRGNIILGSHNIVWIDSLIGQKDLASVSQDTLDWLDQKIEVNSNVVLFSHYSLVPIDGRDNFYFNDDYNYMSYTNYRTVLKILERCRQAITINAHTHMATSKQIGSINSISCLAFSENITAMQHKDANPGIYSTLEITQDQMIFRSYSGKYAILSIEL